MPGHHNRIISRKRLIALVLWLFFIWGNSLMPGEASSAESGFFLQLLRPLIEQLGIEDLEFAHTVIRKIGHFSEYAVLGVLAWRALGAVRPSLAALIGIAAPCIDETIQLFVPERVGAIGDVLIDMAGFALATGICLLVSRTQRSRSQTE